MAIYEPKPITEWTPGERVDYYRRLLKQAEREERTTLVTYRRDEVELKDDADVR